MCLPSEGAEGRVVVVVVFALKMGALSSDDTTHMSDIAGITVQGTFTSDPVGKKKNRTPGR